MGCKIAHYKKLIGPKIAEYDTNNLIIKLLNKKSLID